MESNVNRIEKWVNEEDIAGLTAFRNDLINQTNNTFMDFEVGHKYTNSENRERNRELKATLLKFNYGVTSVTGIYIEDHKKEDTTNTSKEESFFIVNLNNDPNFYDNIFKLSEYYGQDSFLYKEKNNENAVLIGTNNCNFHGYNKTSNAGSFFKNIKAEYMSRIGNVRYAFGDTTKVVDEPNPKTFKDRKEKRMDIPTNIETFGEQSINTKRIITGLSAPILEKLFNRN